MKVNVLFFGILADISNREKLEVKNVTDSGILIAMLNKKFPGIGKTGYIVARNQKVIKDNVELNDGDEVALLPPFAGG